MSRSNGRELPGGNEGAGEKLMGFILRVEELNERKAEITTMISETFKEAKAIGFDPKAMREVIKLRAMDEGTRREHEALRELYLGAVGMLDGSPLGPWAKKKLMGEDLTGELPFGEPDPDLRGTPPPPFEPERDADKRPDTNGSVGPSAGQPSAGAASKNAQKPAAAKPDTPPDTPEQARERGRLDSRAGRRIIDCPYAGNSPLRAYWEMGWLSEQGGGTGMEIPKIWGRREKKEDPLEAEAKGDKPEPSESSGKADNGDAAKKGDGSSGADAGAP